jgi:mRNA-degrading endonuclease YafQ of YafQ-DinJ toxin-antitoxin module
MNNIEILEKAIKVLTGNDTGIKLDFEKTAQAMEELIKENKELKKVIHNIIQNEKFPTVFTLEELNNKWEVNNERSNNK